MRKLSQRQLTEHVNLVKWEEHKKLEKFNMLTIHSLLLNGNTKFMELRAKVEMFNSMLAKGVERKHLQFQYTKKLYEMLRYMVNIKVYERQQEFLEKVYAWAHGGKMDNWQFDGFNEWGSSKSRPTTATTRARPFSAYSRPKSGYNSNRMNLIKLEQPQPKIKQQKKTNSGIDYEKLKTGQVEFFTGQRTMHPQQEQPMRKLKQYQRKVFYDEGEDSELEVVELKEEKSPMMFVFKTVKKEQNEENVMVEGVVPGDSQQPTIQGQINNNQPGDQQQQLQQDDEGNNNIDEPVAEGQAQQQDEPQQIVDKLKPRYKAFIKHDTQLSKNQISYNKGKHHLLQQRNNLIRKVNEDDVHRMKMIEWAKEKSRTKREQKRRAESARIATKKIGIAYKEPVQEQQENVNVINLTSFPVVETKNPRPKTAFRAFNESNRKQLIKNCFITGSMQGHIQKFQPPIGSVASQRDQRIVSLAQRPKKKTFQQILREAEIKVKEQQDEQILNLKQRFARSKVPVETNRIAKSITYHAGTADEEEYEQDEQVFGGGIIGMNMINNPFFKVGKKKKKKKKKK